MDKRILSPMVLIVLGLILACLPSPVRSSGGPEPVASSHRVPVQREYSVGGPAMMRKDLFIEDDPSRCLVLEADTLPCLLDVENFNRRVLTRQKFEGSNPEFVRSRILQEALEVEFWTRKGRESGVQDQGSEEDIRQFLRFFERTESKRIVRQKSYSKEKLRAIYDRHYQSNFISARDLKLRLIGSSDLDFVEKVSRALELSAHNRGTAPSPLADTRLPWSHVKVSALPEEMAAATDTLKPGGHAIVSLPYGHFILHVDSVLVLPEVTFEEAEGALREIAIRDDPDLEYRAQIYWQNNIKEFLAPDTLLLAAWLNAGAPADWGPGARESAPSPGPPHLLLQHTALPELVRGSLRDPSLAVGDTVGPLSTLIGTWKFKVLSRKPGGRPRPFREICDSLKEKLLYPPADLYLNLEKDLRLIRAQNRAALSAQRKLLDAAGQSLEEGEPPAASALKAEMESWLGSLKVEPISVWTKTRSEGHKHQ